MEISAKSSNSSQDTNSLNVVLSWDPANAAITEAVSRAIASLLRDLVPDEKRIEFARSLFRAVRRA